MISTITRLRVAAVLLCACMPAISWAAADEPVYGPPPAAFPSAPATQYGAPCFYEQPCASVPIWFELERVQLPGQPPIEVVNRFRGSPVPHDPNPGHPDRTQIDRSRGAQTRGTTNTWLVYDDRCAMQEKYTQSLGWQPTGTFCGEWAAAPLCPAP